MKKNIVKTILKITVSVVVILALVFGIIKILHNDATAANSTDKAVYTMELLNEKYPNNGFQTVSTSGKFTLLCNFATSEIAVTNNETGAVWYANPQDRSSDSISILKTQLDSNIIIKCEDTSSGNIATVDSTAGSVNKGGMSYKLIENGIRFEYRFPDQGVIIPVEISLFSDGLQAEIISDEIKELNQAAFRLTSVSVLPFFSAAGQSSEGYMLVPDGSGALINFNNGKTDCAPYSQQVYGDDKLLTCVTDKNTVSASVHMPVFGIKSQDNGFFGIVTSGDAQATINAAVSGVTSSYNQIYASFTYCDKFITTIEQNGTHTLKQYGEPNLAGTSFAVSYYLLDKDKADYSSMAECYRNYLVKNEVLSERSKAKDAVALELYGAVTTTKYILGIEKEIVTPLTDYKKLMEVCNDLKGDGIENVEILYRGWQKGGLDSYITTKVKNEPELGDKKELASLIDLTNSLGIKLYFDNDFVNLYKSGNGFTHISDSALLLTQDIAKQMTYRYSSKVFNKDKVWYLTAPSLFEKAVSKFTQNAKDAKIKSVAVLSFGDSLYSDRSEERSSMRYQTQKKISKSLETMKKDINNIAVAGANVYTLKDAKTVFNAPTSNNKFDILDRSIPFYSMVVHGYVQLTSDSLNTSADYQELFLKSIESGCVLKYTLFENDSSLLYGTEYSELFDASINRWYKTVQKEYDKCEELFESIFDKTISSHNEVATGVFETKYEDGTCVLVNYNKSDVNVQGVNVPARYYAFIKGEG